MPTSKVISSVASRTRGKVISATIELIYEVGLSGVTHRKVAEKAGVPLGTTTYHFDSLAELIELAISEEFARDRARRAEVLQRTASDYELVPLLLELIVPGGSSDPELLANVYLRLSEIQFSQDFRHLVKEHQFGVEADIAKLLEQSGTDPLRAGTVLALLDGFLLQWLIYEKPSSWLSGQVSQALRALGVSL